MLKNIASKL